jgi:hypothetical protein
MGSRGVRKPGRVALAVYLEPKLASKLRTVAAKERRSVSMQAALYIERGIRAESR